MCALLSHPVRLVADVFLAWLDTRRKIHKETKNNVGDYLTKKKKKKKKIKIIEKKKF